MRMYETESRWKRFSGISSTFLDPHPSKRRDYNFSRFPKNEFSAIEPFWNSNVRLKRVDSSFIRRWTFKHTDLHFIKVTPVSNTAADRTVQAPFGGYSLILQKRDSENTLSRRWTRRKCPKKSHRTVRIENGYVDACFFGWNATRRHFAETNICRWVGIADRNWERKKSKSEATGIEIENVESHFSWEGGMEGEGEGDGDGDGSRDEKRKRSRKMVGGRGAGEQGEAWRGGRKRECGIRREAYSYTRT